MTDPVRAAVTASVAGPLALAASPSDAVLVAVVAGGFAVGWGAGPVGRRLSTWRRRRRIRRIYGSPLVHPSDPRRAA